MIGESDREQGLEVMITSCKEEVAKQDKRLKCWITQPEYNLIESYKRCEYMYPIGDRIYCNMNFYHKAKGE